MKLSDEKLRPLFLEAAEELNQAFKCEYDSHDMPHYDSNKRAVAEQYSRILDEIYQKVKDDEGCANLCTAIAAMCVYSSHRLHAEYPHYFLPQAEEAKKNADKLLEYCLEKICKDESERTFYQELFSLIELSVRFEKQKIEGRRLAPLHQILDRGYMTYSEYSQTFTQQEILLDENSNNAYLSECIKGWYKLYRSEYAQKHHLEIPAYFLHLYNVTNLNDFLVAITDKPQKIYFPEEISKIETAITDKLSPELAALDGYFDGCIKGICVLHPYPDPAGASASYVSINESNQEQTNGILYHLLPHTMYNPFAFQANRTAQYQRIISSLKEELKHINERRKNGEISECKALDLMCEKAENTLPRSSKPEISSDIEKYFSHMLRNNGMKLSEKTKSDIQLTKRLMSAFGADIDIFMLPLFRSLERELNDKIFKRIKGKLPVQKSHDGRIRPLFQQEKTVTLGFRFGDIFEHGKFYVEKREDLKNVRNEIAKADPGLKYFSQIVEISRKKFICVNGSYLYLYRIRNAICHRDDNDIKKLKDSREGLVKEILESLSEKYKVFESIYQIGKTLSGT